MAKELTITMEPKDERVAVRALVEMFERTLDVLRRLDAGAGEDERAIIQWDVVSVSMNSPLTVTLGPRVPPNQRDRSATVVRGFMRGMAALESKPTLPRAFDEEILGDTRKLVDLLNDGIKRLRFSSPGEEDVSPTLHSAANIDEIMNQRHSFYHDRTTVEGSLEVLSAHNGTKLHVFDALTNHRVECTVTDEQLDQAKEWFRRRVAITGRARFNRKGKPVSIEVESVRVLRDRKELPQPSDFAGPGRVNITGGKDSAEYIRELRDAE